VRILFVMIAAMLGAWRHPPPEPNWYVVNVEWRGGSAELPASSTAVLDEVAFAIKASPHWREIAIGAYGDRGSRARREKLGVRRALAFVHGLEARGVEPERLRVVIPTFLTARGIEIEINIRERA
jgi:hypothetical protein